MACCVESESPQRTEQREKTPEDKVSTPPIHPPKVVEHQLPLGTTAIDSEGAIVIHSDSPDNKQPSNQALQFPWLQSGYYPCGAHSHLHKDSQLKPLSFPEKSGEVSSCFVSEESDLPLQCLRCSAVFNADKTLMEQTSETSYFKGGTETAPYNKDVCSDPPNNDQPETCDSVLSKDGSSRLTKGDTAAKLTPKPPRAKMTPKDEWLRHLLLEHKIVIHKVQEISSLKCYSEYWKKRLGEAPITEFAPVIRTNTDSNFPSEDYYLFSSALPEEKSLRHYLHKKKLEAILEVQQREREDTSFSRRCLFCSQVLTGNRRELFQHMLDSHSFNVGQPDNLVFVREFLDLLQAKLDSLQCLFCERTFRDRVTLKDHMRKKGHKKINAQNKVYDRFYVINYLELGKTWEEVQGEEDRESRFTEESDWLEDPSPLNDLIHCLFCPTPHTGMDSALTHMRDTHGFDFPSLCTVLGLDYYGQVKMVNFVRRRVHANTCVCCNQQCSSLTQLLDHMTSDGHFKLPSNRATWDQSQYLFPTYENDSLLYGLDDGSS